VRFLARLALRLPPFLAGFEANWFPETTKPFPLFFTKTPAFTAFLIAKTTCLRAPELACRFQTK
jgi:hypothetical protein